MALKALEQYIPIPAGQTANIASQNLINNLLGTKGYEVRDGYVVFTEDLTAVNVNAVDMQLIVAAFDKYNDYDQLPIPADMVAQIIDEVVAILLGTPPADKKVDPVAEEAPNKR